jgi:hypothetical protein
MSDYFLFIDKLATGLIVGQNDRVTVKGELERMWQEVDVIYLTTCQSIFNEERDRTTMMK